MACCLCNMQFGGQAWQMQIARDFPWRWAMWWLVLPNLAFIAMWPIGGPRMVVPMTIGGVVALLLSGWGHHPARTLLALGLFLFSLMLYTTMSFNLEPTELLNSIEFAGELDPFQSPDIWLAAYCWRHRLLHSSYSDRASRRSGRATIKYWRLFWYCCW